MPVGGLKRDEARVHAMLLEAVAEAAIRLAGGDSEQPAVLFERIEELEHAIEQRLFDLAGRAERHERLLIVVGKLAMLVRLKSPAGARAIASVRLRPMTLRDTCGGGTARPLSSKLVAARHEWSRRYRPACRRSRRWRGGSSFLGLSLRTPGPALATPFAPARFRRSGGLALPRSRGPGCCRGRVAGSRSNPSIARLSAK